MNARPPVAFGGLPEIDWLPRNDATVFPFYAEWQWLRPLQAILGLTRRTIHDVVSDPRAAAEIRVLWGVYATARRLAAEREERNWVAEQLWLRRQGCPVPCPICDEIDPCGCAER
jgi:hypothetical protein